MVARVRFVGIDATVVHFVGLFFIVRIVMMVIVILGAVILFVDSIRIRVVVIFVWVMLLVRVGRSRVVRLLLLVVAGAVSVGFIIRYLR